MCHFMNACMVEWSCTFGVTVGEKRRMGGEKNLKCQKAMMINPILSVHDHEYTVRYVSQHRILNSQC